MELGSQLGFALVLAAPVACVSWTVTREEVFKEFRTTLDHYQKRRAKSLLWRKLAYMPTCPYCFSHYVTAVFVAVSHFKMLGDGLLGYTVSFFTVVFAANVYLSGYQLLRGATRCDCRRRSGRSRRTVREAVGRRSGHDGARHVEPGRTRRADALDWPAATVPGGGAGLPRRSDPGSRRGARATIGALAAAARCFVEQGCIRPVRSAWP